MRELLTTDEAADYLRMSERKLYELVARAAVPCSKASGRWLFPKVALDNWIAAGLPAATLAPPPPIVGGSHDPLLEWALRESGCGLAGLPEGSEAGLRRLASREVVAAAIHLHRLDGDDETTNGDAVAQYPGLHDAVVIGFARREQGLVVAPDNPLALADVASVVARGARIALRPDGAGAQLLLLRLLTEAGLSQDALVSAGRPCPTGTDIGQAVRAGRADCGIATRAVSNTAGLGFVPLVWENYDLVLRHRDYFALAAQSLFSFLRSPGFSRRAAELGGYDVTCCGIVRQCN